MTHSLSADSVERFDAEYPEGLADRLAWLETRLGVPRRPLLRLMGLSPEQAAALEGRGWRDVVRPYEPQAGRVEHLLSHYLSFFRYDAEEAARFTARFPDRLRGGEINLEEFIPWYKADAPWAEREAALRAAILQDGPGLLPAVAAFLSLAPRAA